MPWTVVTIELPDQRQHLLLRDIGRQPVLERRHAGFLRLLVLAADIDLAGGIIADQHHRESRRYLMFAPHPSYLPGDTGSKL